MNIVVAPQINVQVGLNLAVLSPGAQQTLGQVAGNGLGVGQGGGAGAPAGNRIADARAALLAR
jgi:hypothetical protein